MEEIELVQVDDSTIHQLQNIHIPDSQNRFVKFRYEVVSYEAAGNPWCFCILKTGRCVGYLAAEEDFEGDFHLNKLVIDARYQQHGIGTEALEKFLELARKNGARYVFLSVAYENRVAQRFYEKNGFTKDMLGTAEAGCNLYAICLN